MPRRNLIFSATATLGLLSGVSVAHAAETIPVSIRTAHGPVQYQLELATDPAAREHGLMQRERIGDSDGMLFLFPQSALQRFWMKDTFIPLDILFLNDANAVRKIARGQPESLEKIAAPQPGSAVIELDAGRAAADGIAEGNGVTYALPPTVSVR